MAVLENWVDRELGVGRKEGEAGVGSVRCGSPPGLLLQLTSFLWLLLLIWFSVGSRNEVSV